MPEHSLQATLTTALRGASGHRGGAKQGLWGGLGVGLGGGGGGGEGAVLVQMRGCDGSGQPSQMLGGGQETQRGGEGRGGARSVQSATHAAASSTLISSGFDMAGQGLEVPQGHPQLLADTLSLAFLVILLHALQYAPYIPLKAPTQQQVGFVQDYVMHPA